MASPSSVRRVFLCGVSRRAVRRWRRKGELKEVRRERDGCGCVVGAASGRIPQLSTAPRMNWGARSGRSDAQQAMAFTAALGRAYARHDTDVWNFRRPRVRSGRATEIWTDGGRRRRCAARQRVGVLMNTAQPATTSGRTAKESSITPRDEDFSEWYQDVVRAAELAEGSPVRGTMVIRPNGMATWEAVRDELDRRIKLSGAKNAYFPLLIPQSFLTKEAEHVTGFAKECAVVTHHRLRVNEGTNEIEADPDAKLDEPLVIRPTSETIIWSTFSRWIDSYRDLPLCINQWANVVRWELRPRLFLRTSEFLWQEGHTAHASDDEALAKAKEMIDVYEEVCAEMLALPVIKGVKSPSERFAGAEQTYTIEGMMYNGWALQCGTSHYLGQNFAKAFDVMFNTRQDGVREHVWASSWGVSTRLMGALIMTHSDDSGFVCPPRVAPLQVVVVCIWKKAEQRDAVLTLARAAADRLRRAGYRVEVDDREGIRPGAKYYEWERKGVPLRMEMGPRDAEKNAVFCARRVGGDKFALPLDGGFEAAVADVLRDIQQHMFDAAQRRLKAHTRRVQSYAEMRDALQRNAAEFFLVPWKEDDTNEQRVKEETKATIRCYPLDGQEEADSNKCFFSGEPATHMAIFARAF